MSYRQFLVLFVLLASLPVFGASKSARWTGKEDTDASLDHVISVLNQKTGFALKTSDFQLLEDRDLANNHFSMYQQMASGVPVARRSIRVWTDLKNQQTVQIEASVEDEVANLVVSKWLSKKGLSSDTIKQALSSAKTNSIVRKAVQSNLDDKQIQSIKWTDEWESGQVVRFVKAKGRHGNHMVKISTSSGKLLEYKYEEYPQISMAARVFPIYEEDAVNHHIQKQMDVELKYLKDKVARPISDPYAAMASAQHYTFDKFDPILGMIPEYRAQGYWAMTYIKEQAAQIRSQLPLTDNTYKNGVILEGEFATINLHPDVMKLKGLNFTPSISSTFRPNYTEEEMIPTGSLIGRPFMTSDEAYNRLAERLQNHDPVAYLNDGFDEIQVYYAINTLMEGLHNMGFSDPELSTRPFNAFLYDPDIGMKDNAYYTDDTINFTTYSSDNQNFARDNSTIWHELGHGIMDRLMGDYLQLADTGGLSEGMADFVAQMIIQYVSGGVPFEGSNDFRIINHIGFFLTNEVHDDGEAYGGTMNDFMLAAINQYGREGLVKVADVVMEAMRLTRDHPALTAQEWFNHILFADELGSSLRKPGELSPLLHAALAGRNYRFDDKAPASITLKNNGTEVVSGGIGTRNSPIPLKLKATDKATYHLEANLTGSDTFSFKYPVTIRVMLDGGPLEGAIKWDNEKAQPFEFVLNSESDVAKFDLTANGTCDFVNREDGSCVDYAYIQVLNAGETRPVAKKRFYLRIKTVN